MKFVSKVQDPRSSPPSYYTLYQQPRQGMASHIITKVPSYGQDTRPSVPQLSSTGSSGSNRHNAMTPQNSRTVQIRSAPGSPMRNAPFHGLRTQGPFHGSVPSWHAGNKSNQIMAKTRIISREIIPGPSVGPQTQNKPIVLSVEHVSTDPYMPDHAPGYVIERVPSALPMKETVNPYTSAWVDDQKTHNGIYPRLDTSVLGMPYPHVLNNMQDDVISSISRRITPEMNAFACG